MIKALVKIVGSVVICSLLTVSCSQAPQAQPEQPAAAPVQEVELPDEEVAPIVDADAPAYIGLWVADGGDCSVTPGSAENAPIAFTAEEYISLQGLCRTGFVDEKDDGSFAIEVTCLGEEAEYQQLLSVAVDGSSISIETDGGEAQQFGRC